jgi:pimeloyl-ACP methyl ester carboxylesterase
LVTVSGYNVQNIADASNPAPPQFERKLWYQYYLHSDRGRAGLAAYRADYARQLWSEWSPSWNFSEADFAATAASFDNPDFVEVVVHSYRHRYGLVPGDPNYQQAEEDIAVQPLIAVPTIVLDPTSDTLIPPAARDTHEQHFSNLIDYRTIESGHNAPQENPGDFAQAVLDLHATVKGATYG